MDRKIRTRILKRAFTLKRFNKYIESYLASRGITDRKYLLCTDFPDNGGVAICFKDGSSCEFDHAFVYEKDSKIIVFTEHCGYHEFDNSHIKAKRFNKYK